MAHAASHDDGSSHGHGGHGGKDHVPHVLPITYYFGVWGALMVLTAVTVGVSYLDFGEFNLIIAMVVATIKAGLVAAIFMHLWFDGKFNAIVLAISLIFLFVFIAVTRLDVVSRGLADPLEAKQFRTIGTPFAADKGSAARAADAEKALQTGVYVPVVAPASPAAPGHGASPAPAHGAAPAPGAAPPAGAHGGAPAAAPAPVPAAPAPAAPAPAAPAPAH